MMLIKIIDLLLPSYKAFKVNKKLKKELDIKKDKFDELKNEWISKIKDNTKSVINMAQDINQTEFERKNSHEQKAQSLLSSVGVVISLITIFFAIFDQNWQKKYYMAFFIIILFFSILNFLLTGICAAKSLRLGEFYILNNDTLRTCLESNHNIINENWIAEKITNLDFNKDTLLIRSNWLDAAQSHFLYGIYFLSITFITILINFINIKSIFDYIVHFLDC
ncbi:MAG: hypothetical protein ACFFDN_48055 [Candidatus Hodarchaeota archaeon]